MTSPPTIFDASLDPPVIRTTPFLPFSVNEEPASKYKDPPLLLALTNILPPTPLEPDPLCSITSPPALPSPAEIEIEPPIPFEASESPEIKLIEEPTCAAEEPPDKTRLPDIPPRLFPEPNTIEPDGPK